MSVIDRVRDLVAPLCADADVELFDLEHNGGVLRVSVDKEGGVDMATLQGLTRAVSRALDEADPIGGRYTLEVSSPGLERALRTPTHFRWAEGKDVKIKTRPEVEGERRVEGRLADVDDHGVTVVSGETRRRLDYEDIAKARTVFEWGPAPKPGKGASKRSPAGEHRSDTRKAAS